MKFYILAILTLVVQANILEAVPMNRWHNEDEACVDKYPEEECKKHAAHEGYCDYEKEFMEKNCKKTCGYCLPQAPVAGIGAACEDKLPGCKNHSAIDGYCDYHAEFMRKNCPRSCGFCRQLAPPVNTKILYWKTTPWNECINGKQSRGVQCFHVYQGKDYQVDLKYCREAIKNEAEPADERSC
ncbi:uncharacterized protein LOC124446229 [Xenia sp. Carnegie-2017]|uniref:uncharacterized protein LOC124446229 n=1 Tax=Xenia sp. Carnegie-2017 TaxID=2897299 RepID=UPI001F04CA8B|nr:uncharacterized protein LOC124446229 [Xenia sp. Carnegie-2017]